MGHGTRLGDHGGGGSVLLRLRRVRAGGQHLVAPLGSHLPKAVHDMGRSGRVGRAWRPRGVGVAVGAVGSPIHVHPRRLERRQRLERVLTVLEVGLVVLEGWLVVLEV